jgi:DNA-binding MarR family transcriptional regulator
MHSKKELSIDYQLKVLWQNIVNKYNSIAGEYGITQAMGYILLNVDEEKGISVSEVANLLGLKTTSLSRMLNKLEELGAIKRKMDTFDKRKVIINLTKKGKEKRKIAKIVVKEFNEHLNASISKKEFEDFNRIMHKLNLATLEYGN